METHSNSNKFKKVVTSKGFVTTLIVILLALTLIISASVAANRTKRKNGVNGGTKTDITTTIEEESITTIIDKGQAQTPNSGNDSNPVAGKPDADFNLPVSGKIFKRHDATLQVYSSTMDDYRVHLGVDILTEEAAPVYAAADGTVSKIWSDPLMGVCLAIDHKNDVTSVYKNLDSALCSGISVGTVVKAGQQIGKVGDSAISELADEAHLHFEMTANGIYVDPLDHFSDTAVSTLMGDTGFEPSAVTAEETTTTVSGK